MRIETYHRGSFQVLRIHDGDTISDLSELKDLITGYLSRGKRSIAVGFTDASYIYSGALKALISCHNLIKEQGGELCILEPNPKLVDILELLNINRVIKIYLSEDSLPGSFSQPA